MATKADRGTKRTCQDPKCAARFYDLGRKPIACPVCAANYQIVTQVPAVDRKPGQRRASVYPVPATIREVEDVLPVGATEDTAIESPGDETLPEEQDDEGVDALEVPQQTGREEQ
jgi:uncharacterized protein (TIGR02300 family)